MYLLLLWPALGLAGYIFCIEQQNKRYGMTWGPTECLMGCLSLIAGPFVLIIALGEI